MRSRESWLTAQSPKSISWEIFWEISMDFHGFLWISMDFHALECGSQDTCWPICGDGLRVDRAFSATLGADKLEAKWPRAVATAGCVAQKIGLQWITWYKQTCRILSLFKLPFNYHTKVHGIKRYRQKASCTHPVQLLFDVYAGLETWMILHHRRAVTLVRSHPEAGSDSKTSINCLTSSKSQSISTNFQLLDIHIFDIMFFKQLEFSEIVWGTVKQIISASSFVNPSPSLQDAMLPPVKYDQARNLNYRQTINKTQ